MQKGNTVPGVKILVGYEVVRNRGCGLAKHIRHDGIQRHIADGEGILKAVFPAASHRFEFVAVTSQLAEDADILVRDKAAFPQADAEQISNLFGVLGIILVALYGLDPFGVCNDDIIPRFSGILKAGTQYFPVDSMQTSRQSFSWSQSAKLKIVSFAN